MMRKLGKIAYIISSAFLICAMVLSFIPANPVYAEKKTEICHWDEGKREFSTRLVSVNSVLSGHGDHVGDAWLPFTLEDGTLVPGQGDQAVAANHCVAPIAASVGYSIGTCVYTPASGSLTPVTITIVGATVHTGAVAGDITTSQTLNLAPGSYSWNWEAIAPAYTGSGTISFIVGDCTPPPLPFGSAAGVAGTCAYSAGTGSYTPVVLTISNAVVHTGAISGDITTSQTINVPPGSYSWPWEAASGYQGSGTISITASDCTPPSGSGNFDIGSCTLDGLKKTVTVTLSNASAVITGTSGPFNFSSSGSIDLIPGSYTFSWTADSGYLGSGSTPFIVTSCPSGTGSYDVGACNVDGSKRNVSVTLSNASGQITGAGGPYDFSSPGGNVDLTPGAYNFSWAADSGFKGSGSTGFTVPTCPASTGDVEVGSCTADGTKKTVTVYLTNATGSITGPGGPYAFTGAGGTQDLVPGSYSFSWTSIAGYQGSGTIPFTVEQCPTGSAGFEIGACSWNIETGSKRSVTVTLDNANAVITGSGGPYNFPGASNPIELGVGTYTFTWDGITGYQGGGTSDIVIDECPLASASVDPNGTCVWTENDGSKTPVTVVLDHATATITGPSPDLTSYNFPGSVNPLSLGPGSYTFDWIATEGYRGSGSSQFTTVECIPLGKLGLNAICAADPTNFNGWKVINTNSVQMPYEYSGAGGVSGTGTVDANSTAEFATARSGSSDDLTLYSGGELQAYSKAKTGCINNPPNPPNPPTPPQIPVTGNDPAILIPVTGLDTAMVRRVLPGTLMSFGFGFLGIGLIFTGIARRKKE